VYTQVVLRLAVAERTPNTTGIYTSTVGVKMQKSTDTYRIVAGLKGDINENYSWQIDGTYSRATATQQIYGGANGAVMNQLLTPLLNAAGTAYQTNAAGRVLSAYSDSAGPVPVWNFFSVEGFQQDPRAVNAVSTVLFKNGLTQLTQFNALFRGTPSDAVTDLDSYALHLGRVSDLEAHSQVLCALIQQLNSENLVIDDFPDDLFGSFIHDDLFAAAQRDHGVR